jgi:hypothetical protein
MTGTSGPDGWFADYPDPYRSQRLQGLERRHSGRVRPPDPASASGIPPSSLTLLAYIMT